MTEWPRGENEQNVREFVPDAHRKIELKRERMNKTRKKMSGKIF